MTSDTCLATLIRVIIREELRVFIELLKPPSDVLQSYYGMLGIKKVIQTACCFEHHSTGHLSMCTSTTSTESQLCLPDLYGYFHR